MKAVEKIPDKSRKRRGFSMWFVLAATFGALVAVSVGIVLYMSAKSNLENTFSLLNERGETLINGMERAIRQETERTQSAVRTLAALYDDGTIATNDRTTFEPFLRTILIAEPSVEALLVFSEDGNVTDLLRRPDGIIAPFPEGSLTPESSAAITSQLSGTANEPVWGDPVYIGPVLFHFVSAPLMRDGKLRGHVVAAVGRYVINRIISEVGRDNETTAFVLDHENNVIAYSRQPDLLRNRTSIPMSEFPDKSLAQISQAEKTEEFQTAFEKGVSILETGDRNGFIYITKPLKGYAGVPYTLGAYFAKSDIGREVFRAVNTMFAGIGGLLLAVVFAILLGRRISRPMTAIAEAARKLSVLDLEGMNPLKSSRIREIDNQAEALNKLRMAMREFSRYVPRPLVERLIRSGEESIRTVERELTILFSDIIEFTTLSERMNAPDTATILNAIFDIQCREIEAQAGTVDKFMGDGLMAFWGAPDADPDHASHAIESATKIASAVRVFNRERREKGLPPLRLRMGIHTGRVVVGNIGGGSRQNYTIIGDAVNVTQRIEQMGKELMAPDDDTIVLVSDQAAKAADGQFALKPVGTRVIRGRERPVAVFILDTGSITDSANVVAFPGAGRAS